MHPNIHVNFAAVLAAVVVTVAIGSAWYGPLFGKAWIKLAGVSAKKPNQSQMMRSMVIMIVGAFLTAYVLSHTVQVWRPSTWNSAWTDESPCIYGFFSGFFTWLGFYVPLLMGPVAWENKPWKLFWLNAGYYFVSLQAISMILAYWP